MVRPPSTLTNAVTLSMMDAMTQAEEDRQSNIVLARKYHSGEQGVQLTARLKQFLGEDVLFRMNICQNIITAVAERLTVTGFDCTDTNVIQWAWNTWQRSELDAKQEEIYEGALRDGEYFVVVGWDNIDEGPIVVPHQRYTDGSVDGDGEGCWIVYEQNDPNQKALYGVKQWLEYDRSATEYSLRRTEYFPDHIIKYRRGRFDAEWAVLETLEWLDKAGKPLGIAVVPFNNKGLRCEAWEAIPLQNAINKSLLDLLSSSDMTAFRIFYALGFIPTSDGKALKEDLSNALKIEPGRIVGTTKSSREATFGSIEPADLNSQMDLTHQLVLWAAMVTNTPVSRFISTKLIASDATLKEQEGPLMSRARSRQNSFGNSWSKVFTLLRKMEAVFGKERLDEEPRIDVLWGEPASRGEQEKVELLSSKRRDLEIPRRQIWIEAGYDQIKIAEMEAMREKEGRDARRQSGNGTEPRTGTAEDADTGGTPEGTGEDTESTQGS